MLDLFCSSTSQGISILLFGLLWDFSFRFPAGKQSAALGPLGSYCAISRSCQYTFPVQVRIAAARFALKDSLILLTFTFSENTLVARFRLRGETPAP
jgi:hypothetical protein